MNLERPELSKGRFHAILAAGVYGVGVMVLIFFIQRPVSTANNGGGRSAMRVADVTSRPDFPSVRARAGQLEGPAAADLMGSMSRAPQALFYGPDYETMADNVQVNEEGDSSLLVDLEDPERPAATGRNLTEAELKLLGAQAGQEAIRRLQVLTRKYNLSKEQQALVFPVVARASPAYGQLSSFAGEMLADAYVVQPNSFPLSETLDSTTASRSDETAQNELFEPETTDPPGKAPSKTKASPESADDDVPPSIPWDILEPQLAPFLNPAQLAKMNEEQIDRYYWWGEILLQLNGDIEAAAAVISSALESDGVPSVETEPAVDAVPTAYQGGISGYLNSLP